MPLRLGRQGSLCFVCDDRQAIAAISDGQHRKDPVPFHEVDLPAAGTGPGQPDPGDREPYFDSHGPSWARQLGAVAIYAELNQRIAELGLALRIDPAGFEQDVDSRPAQRRDLHYHELNRPGAAALVLSFTLQEPFRWQIHCPGLQAREGAFHLPSNVQAWISSAHPVRHDRDRLWVDLPAGTHSIMLVVVSRRTGLELHDTALIVRPEDAPIAAVAQACVPDRLLPTLPVASDDDLREAAAVLAELGIRRAVVVDALGDRAGALGLADDGLVIVSTRAGADWSGALTAALQPAAPDPGEVPGLGDDTARGLYEVLADPGEAAASGAGLVICDSARPCVRVIAAAYAALAGYTLELIEVDEEPVAEPDWGAAHPEPLVIRVERHRVALAQQAARVLAPQLPPKVPRVAVAFTRGYAYSLLPGRRGPWGGEVELGMLPEGQAPALLLRALGHGSAPAPRSGVTLLVDTLGGPEHRSEYEPVRASASATVALPVGLADGDATAPILRGAAGELPVDLITLICHGERDFVELTDGPLTAAELASWRLPSSPVVVNNSCSSRHTTGPAFLTAGARAYVGTLWPVESAAAARVCAEMVRALTSLAETRVGAALAGALADASGLEYDDRFAYVLVGLPTVPARLAPVLDDRQQAEITEHGLIAAYAAAGRMIDAGQPAVARWVRANVIEALLADLRAAMSADAFGGWLEVLNAPGSQLEAITAIHDADFVSHLAASGEATINDQIDAHDHAVASWEAALENESDITCAERRLTVVAHLLARLTLLLAEAGRGDTAWLCALCATATVTNPSKPVPLDPPEADAEALVSAARALREPEYLNAVGLLAAERRGPETAEHCYRAGLELTTDPGETGRITSNLAKLRHEQNRLAEAAAGYAEALPLLQAAGDIRSIEITRAHLARLRLDQGDLNGAGSTRAEQRALADRAGSPEELAVVEDICARAVWRRVCVVWLSPADGRTRSMIIDRPPASVPPPLHIRYPLIDGASVRDAYVENVACWARMRNAVAYRFDGTPGLIVVDRVGLVRATPHGYRYRAVWGSRQFIYSVQADLPESAIVTGVTLKPHGLGPGPPIGISRDGQCMTVVLQPSPIVELLAEHTPGRPFGMAWHATVTIDFAEAPAIHEALIEHLEEHQLISPSVYTDLMNRVVS